MSDPAARPRAPRLMLIVTVADVTARLATITAALAAGVDAVQLRDRQASGRSLLAAAESLRPATRAHGGVLLVNDRVDVALAVGADGVHLPAASFPIAVTRRLVGPDAWIGRSTHSPAEAEAAAAEGADYVVLGPIYATPSKAAFGPPLGIDAIAAARTARPLLAIGGITADRVAAVRRAGADGVAVIRAILDAPDPGAAAAELRAAVRNS